MNRSQIESLYKSNGIEDYKLRNTENLYKICDNSMELLSGEILRVSPLFQLLNIRYY